MQNFSHWNQIEEFLSTSDNHTKVELFEQLTESYLNWNSKKHTKTKDGKVGQISLEKKKQNELQIP